jgi:predicted NBD/HSP70 family sugar kinase
MVIDPRPKCQCGRKGCWRLYVSDSATLNATLLPTPVTTLRRPDSFGPPEMNARSLPSGRQGRFLSLRISNIVFALNPEKIVLEAASPRSGI